MRRWYRPITRGATDHGRARDLAALRLAETLPADDASWLDAHLARCEACRAVAGEYEEQRSALRALRIEQPAPPRDLWARTAAAMEVSRRRPGPRTRLAGSVQLAPVAALLVIAIVVGAGLLNGTSLLPPAGGTGDSSAAVATPIALAAGELQVITRSTNGQVEIQSRQVNELCPVGVEACGASTALDVTRSTTLNVPQSAAVDGSGGLDAIISPGRDRLVVVERGTTTQSVYVLPIAGGTPSPGASVLPPPPTQQPAASPTGPVDTATPTAPGNTASPTPTPRPTRAPSATPGTPSPTASATASPSVTATPRRSTEPPSGRPTPSNQSQRPSPSPTPSGSGGAAAPTPSVEVTPGPDGALEIARDVTIVGAAPAYAPDGRSLAFSARPADGSAGPDIYVWQTGDPAAVAVTIDHGSVFAGWLGDRVLASRVVGGVPLTVAIAPETGVAEPVGTQPMWLPMVAPDGHDAVWWDGTLRLAADGLSWLPDSGRLILAPWPNDGGNVQVLATGPLADWDVRWDETRSVLAVWLRTGESGSVGRLSLYPIDPATDLADVARPRLADAPAYAGFSLHAGRLVWTAPDDTGDSSVQVLAWSGDKIGQLALPGLKGPIVIR